MDTALPLYLDFFLKAGVPAGLGVFIVMYLLRVIIPAQQKAFTNEMAESRKLFRDVMESEQRSHTALIGTLTEAMKAEGKQTRGSIDRLNDTSMKLHEVVFKMYGSVATPGDRRLI
jgi:hypothetical protein